jgi:hypothetical protein
MIKHTVVFKLKYPHGSAEEQNFFRAAQELASITGVEKFESLRQTSKNTNYDFGLAMEFANEDLYEQYKKHPLHVKFIQQYWLPSVTEFMEIDYEPLRNDHL